MQDAGFFIVFFALLFFCFATNFSIFFPDNWQRQQKKNKQNKNKNKQKQKTKKKKKKKKKGLAHRPMQQKWVHILLFSWPKLLIPKPLGTAIIFSAHRNISYQTKSNNFLVKINMEGWDGEVYGRGSPAFTISDRLLVIKINLWWQ